MAVSVPWEQLRWEYEQENATYQVLAERYGVSVSTISRRARAEEWSRRSSTDRCLAAVTRQLMGAVEETLTDRSAPVSVRELKDLTALVRELLTLQELAEGPKEQDEGLRVVLEGEAESWGE